MYSIYKYGKYSHNRGCRNIFKKMGLSYPDDRYKFRDEYAPLVDTVHQRDVSASKKYQEERNRLKNQDRDEQRERIMKSALEKLKS